MNTIFRPNDDTEQDTIHQFQKSQESIDITKVKFIHMCVVMKF